MNEQQFELHLTDEQYDELSNLWHEFAVLLGPTREQGNLASIALEFSEWIDTNEDHPRYGLPEIAQFFLDKEQREGTALPKEHQEERT